MSRHSVTAIALAIGLACASPALAQDAPRPVVTIPGFDTSRTGWAPPAGFGQTLAERLGERLVASGRFRVLDASFLTADSPGARALPDLSVLRADADRAGAQYLVL